MERLGYTELTIVLMITLTMILGPVSMIVAVVLMDSAFR
jgi:hypothetical protein